MSDMHTLPLKGHDLETRILVRAQVFRTTPCHWWWSYLPGAGDSSSTCLRHGPFETHAEAYTSARRMVELL